MSASGCNLIGDGISSDSGDSGNTGRCVCGPAVPWCPGEARPYVYGTRKECKLNLAAKIAYGKIIYIWICHLTKHDYNTKQVKPNFNLFF